MLISRKIIIPIKTKGNAFNEQAIEAEKIFFK